MHPSGKIPLHSPPFLLQSTPMGRIKEPDPAFLFAGMLSSLPGLFLPAAERMASRFGKIFLESPLIAFSGTDYYSKEMGEPLFKIFFAFSKPFDPESLPEVKHLTNRMEEELQGKEGLPRPLNIDPGYLTLSKVVLASTKDHTHRILLRNGIYGEVTLAYRGKEFQFMEWTYPDYRRRDYLEFFLKMRRELYSRFLQNLKAQRAKRENRESR